MTGDPLAGLVAPSGSPGALRSAAAGHVAAAGGLDAASHALTGAVSATQASWVGPASAAAGAVATVLSGAQVRVGQASERVGAALRTYALLLDQAQAQFARARALADQAVRDEAAHRDDAARQLAAGPLVDPVTTLLLSAAAGGSDGWASPSRQAARAMAEAAVQDAQRAAQQAAGEVSAATAGISPPPPPPAARPQREHHWYDGVLHQTEGLVTGVWDGVAEPAKMVGGLVGLNGDVSDNWSALGGGLAHGVTHPLDFGKALVNWEDLAAGEYGHWAGELVPSVVAALLTGGVAAGAKGAEGAAALSRSGRALREVSGSERVAPLAPLRRPLPDLSDIPFRKGTSEWADEVARRHPDLTSGDALAIHDYTTSEGYAAMNTHMRSGGSDPAVQARVDATTAALAKLPPHPGTTFRGTHLPDDVLAQYQPGNVVHDRAFTSSSTSAAVARDFGPVDLTIHGRSGVDIAPLSEYGTTELEVLFRGGTEFEVVQRFVDSGTGRLQIELREVAR